MARDQPEGEGARCDHRRPGSGRGPSGWLSLQTFRVALEHAYDAVVITTSELDPPGPEILYVNAAFTGMTGYEAAEVIGQTPRILQGPKTSRRVLDRLRMQLERGEPFAGRVVNYRKDGSEFWLEWRIAPVFDEHHHVLHFVSLQRDVTESVRMLTTLQQSRAEIDRLARERKIELEATMADNERLLRREHAARLRAEAAEAELRGENRNKDEFLAMLAHELRNPLSSIATATQLMKLGPPAKPVFQRACGVLERQTSHLVRLVDDLLDTARLTKGTIVLRKERVELDKIVAETIETNRALIRDRRHALTVSLPKQSVVLEGDSTRLVQALGNLLTNAARYTPEGGKIWIEAQREDSMVAIRVRDNGIGIEPSMHDKVFDLFSQVHHGNASKQGGLGLGLTLTRRLVELHGGTVEVSSAGLGAGSEFIIRLPAQSQAARDDFPGPTRRSSDQQTAALRILVVEDNRDARDTLMMLLSAQGHVVQAAEDGPGALERTGEFDPDLILLDIGLPGMNGYEVARRLRERDGACTRLVALTGYGREQDRARSREAGIDAHLTKPVSPEQLAEEIALASKRCTRDTDSQAPPAGSGRA
jgi:PAS domain S-box-containing protein